MLTSPVLISEAAMSNMTVLDAAEPFDLDVTPSSVAPYPISFQVSLGVLLLLELVLGLGSNLTVLVLYCMRHNLVSSVSNIVTMNLHVLDVLVCVSCLPLTAAVLLLPPGADSALLCCFHEACVSFASVATAANVLAITVDRYDISVRPANRVLTTGRAAALLGAIWALSLLSFLVPFVEVGFFSQAGLLDAGLNRTSPADAGRYDAELGLYYHLLAQIPIFLFTVVVMLVTYYKILQALNIRIGTRFQHNPPKKKKKKTTTTTTPTATAEKEKTTSSLTTPGGDGTAAAAESSADASRSGGAGAGPARKAGSGGGAPLGMRTSVSVIIALRRAVRRHRERRERQRRVFRMSLLIVSTFLLCWTPITVLNAVLLSAGPGELAPRLRLGFLVMAYGTTVFHPLLYAFTRQKFQKVLRSKMKKRPTSAVEADPAPNNTVIHNSWIDPGRNRKVTFEETEVRRKCLSSEGVE